MFFPVYFFIALDALFLVDAFIVGGMNAAIAAGLIRWVAEELVVLFQIEGSSTLWEREPKQIEMTLEKHQDILEESIAAFGGHVFKTIGDALIRSTALQIELKPKSLIHM